VPLFVSRSSTQTRPHQPLPIKAQTIDHIFSLFSPELLSSRLSPSLSLMLLLFPHEVRMLLLIPNDLLQNPSLVLFLYLNCEISFLFYVVLFQDLRRFCLSNRCLYTRLGAPLMSKKKSSFSDSCPYKFYFIFIWMSFQRSILLHTSLLLYRIESF
jgi:hypothetical protein